MADEVQVLPRKVLVDEQVFHAAWALPDVRGGTAQRLPAGLDDARGRLRVGRFGAAPPVPARAPGSVRLRQASPPAQIDRLERLQRRQAFRLAALTGGHRATRAAVDEGRRVAALQCVLPRRPSAAPSGQAAAVPCRGCRRTCRPRSRVTASRGPAPPGTRHLRARSVVRGQAESLDPQAAAADAGPFADPAADIAGALHMRHHVRLALWHPRGVAASAVAGRRAGFGAQPHHLKARRRFRPLSRRLVHRHQDLRRPLRPPGPARRYRPSIQPSWRKVLMLTASGRPAQSRRQ